MGLKIELFDVFFGENEGFAQEDVVTFFQTSRIFHQQSGQVRIARVSHTSKWAENKGGASAGRAGFGRRGNCGYPTFISEPRNTSNTRKSPTNVFAYLARV